MSGKDQKRKAFSRFKGMWLFTMFDLPVTGKKKRKEYAFFRSVLLAEGFSMLQYSVYAKYCQSRENSLTYQKRLKNALPSGGQVRLLCVTDKQFSDMLVFYGKREKKPEKKPEQIMLL